MIPSGFPDAGSRALDFSSPIRLQPCFSQICFVMSLFQNYIVGICNLYGSYLVLFYKRSQLKDCFELQKRLELGTFECCQE